MGKKILRSGIIGCGFAGSFHFDAIQRVTCAKVEVVGAFDLSSAQRQAFADARGIPPCGDLKALIEEADMLHICVPAAVHETVAAAVLAQDKFAIVEKPLTGYFGDGSESFRGDTCDKQLALSEALGSVRRMLEAERHSNGRILYAENWVYAPAIQKEREIIERTGAQILWLHGEQAHSGSHAETYAYWKYSGGGVMLGKGCHPLSAALYLKRVEGRTRNGTPIRPQTVTARTHAITRLPDFEDRGHLRCDYHDIDDFSMMHITFEDGTIATVFASDIIMGGVHNWLEVAANNHRTICNINPNTAMQTYNPVESYFDDVYTVEKIGTKQGWSCPSPDENWFGGYQQEVEAFYRTAAFGERVESDSGLAADCISTTYSAYLSAAQKGTEVVITHI